VTFKVVSPIAKTNLCDAAFSTVVQQLTTAANAQPVCASAMYVCFG